MSFNQFMRKFCGICLVLAMVFAMAVPVAAADVNFKEVDSSRVSASLLEEGTENSEEPIVAYNATDVVRVAIILEGKSVIEQGYSTTNIAKNNAAMNYRKSLEIAQNYVTKAIERKIGEDLDVQWNLTLATNAISAYVEYGQIETIEKVDGVKEVIIEMQYSPAVLADNENTNDPKMAVSTGMTGMTEMFSNGYTGAGSRIAIIDTGIDTDHQSFDANAYLYALAQNAIAADVSYEEYLESLDLLDIEEIMGKMNQLNVSSYFPGILSSELYKSEKIAFGFNYVDKSVSYIDHYDDSQTDHGSHVAGIAAANRYIETSENTYKDALSETAVVGNAPDAQIIVMKVFGIGGGAFDSDIVAAMEDAVIFGADSINMSLGNGRPDFSSNSLYDKAVSVIEESDAVLAVAAGNEYAWPTFSNTEAIFGNGSGKLYTDDVMMDRVANPSSLSESLSVASVQNDGLVSSNYMKINGADGKSYATSYSETLYNNMRSFGSLDTSTDKSGTPYEFVLIEGYGEPGDLDFINVENKIVFIQRGNEVAFFDKAHLAVENGAIATVIYNNVYETAGMDLTDYKYDNPCVIITKDAGMQIKALATEKVAEDNTVYYTGTIRIYKGSEPTALPYNSASYTMSSFSNWGTTGDLELKPEITAPGGNIYSVNGRVEDTDQYRIDSGTSMASPQVAGVVASFKEYLRETSLANTYKLSERVLTQSLMMSTAIPLKDASGNYYSLLQQGAGLVNGAAMISAESFIMMDQDATPSYADGKVKAEVGDDPQRKGIYEFSFDLYNTSNEVKIFDMSADAFAQQVSENISAPGANTTAYYMEKNTVSLSSYAVFSVEGEAQKDSTVQVPAKSSVTVSVRLVLNDDAKTWIDKYYPNGTYVQAFVFATPQSNAEGAKTATHSIPMLGFYGSWTESSMYDGGSFHEGKVLTNYSTPNTTDDSRKSYVLDFNAYNDLKVDHGDIIGANHVTLSADADSAPYAFGGNPLVNEVYHPERNALKNGAVVNEWKYLLIRGSESHSYKISNTTTGEIYKEESFEQRLIGAYCYINQGIWLIDAPDGSGLYYPGSGYIPNKIVNYTIPDAAEGDVIEISLTHLPEYYSEGNIGENAVPGDGATLSVSATIDSTVPVANDVAVNADGTLDVTATDSSYVAAVVLYSADGEKVISYTGSKDEIEKGESAVYTVDTIDGVSNYLLQVYDYAMNVSTYYIEIQEEEIEYSGTLLSYDLEDGNWVNINKHSGEMEAVVGTSREYTAATSVGDTIYAVSYGSELFKLSVSDPSAPTFVADLGVNPVDLAYNKVDGQIYGVTDDSMMVRINPENGSVTVLGNTPIETNTLACDENGVFYSNRYGSGSIYSYTLDSLKKSDLSYDFDGDGVVNESDAQVLLEYITGERGNVKNKSFADIDSDGDIDTYDVTLLLDKIPGSAKLVANVDLVSKYMQSMEVDPNNNTLYWASYSTAMFGNTEVGFSVLYEINTETGEYVRYKDVWHQLSGLIILDKQVGSIYEPVGGTVGLEGEEDKLYVGSKEASGIAHVLGVDNSVKSNYLASVDGVSDQKTFTVDLSSDVNTSNGKYTVTYDAETMTLDSYEGFGEFVSFKEKTGSITFGYAGKTKHAANDVVATLTFTGVACESSVSVCLDEINNDHPKSTNEIGSGSHTWKEWTLETPATCSSEGKEVRICEECDTVEERVLPADGSAHKWDEGKILTEIDGSSLGEEELTCSLCGETMRQWMFPDGAELTDVSPITMDTIPVNDAYIYEAQIYNAGVTKAQQIKTDDGSVRFIAELSSTTNENGYFDVSLSNWVGNNTGSGYGIRSEIIDEAIVEDYWVSGSGNASDLDYEVTLNDGIGMMHCYSYYEKTNYTEFYLYFYVGDTDSGNGQMTYVDVPVNTSSLFDPYLTQIGIWDVDVMKCLWEEPVYDEASKTIHYIGDIWIAPSAKDEIYIDFNSEGTPASGWKDVYYVKDGVVDRSTDLVRSGLSVSLEQNVTAFEVVTDFRTAYGRHYTINLHSGTETAPVLNGNNASTASILLGETFNLDLSQLFTDKNGDELTYTVSVNGGEAQDVEADYFITPESAGTMVLTFKANDGSLDSDPYTLVLKVRSDDINYGDTNGDGKLNSKDATILLRYLAGWDNIELDENAADVNVDGKVNSKDATVLLRYLAGWDDVMVG